MRLILIAFAFALSYPLYAEDTFELVNGTEVAFDAIDFSPSRPKMAYGVKHGDLIAMYALDQVKTETLPEDIQSKLVAYTAEQKAQQIVLYKNEWVDRNGMLLKTDKRFAYTKKMRRNGRNRIDIINNNDYKMTIGLRLKGKGYEITALPKKTKKVGFLPKGNYQIYYAYESTDGTKLHVIDHGTTTLELHHFTLTLDDTLTNATRGKHVGDIAIPESMR